MAENTIVQTEITEKLKNAKANMNMLDYNLLGKNQEIEENNKNSLTERIFFGEQANAIMFYNHNLQILNSEKLKDLPNNQTINLPIVFNTKINNSNEPNHFIPINCKITKNNSTLDIKIECDNQINKEEQNEIKEQIKNAFPLNELKIEVLNVEIAQEENKKLSSIDYKNFGSNNCLIATYYNLQYANGEISEEEINKIKGLEDNEIRQKFFSDMLVNYFKNRDKEDLNKNLIEADVAFINNLAINLFDDKDIQNIKDLFTINKPIDEIIDINALNALKVVKEKKDEEGAQGQQVKKDEKNVENQQVKKDEKKSEPGVAPIMPLTPTSEEKENNRQQEKAIKQEKDEQEFDNKLAEIDEELGELRYKLSLTRRILKNRKEADLLHTDSLDFLCIKDLNRLSQLLKRNRKTKINDYDNVIEIKDVKTAFKEIKESKINEKNNLNNNQGVSSKKLSEEEYNNKIKNYDIFCNEIDNLIDKENIKSNNKLIKKTNKEIRKKFGNKAATDFKFVLESDPKTKKTYLTVAQAVIVINNLLKENNVEEPTVEDIMTMLNVNKIQPDSIQNDVKELVAKEFQARRILMNEIERFEEKNVVNINDIKLINDSKKLNKIENNLTKGTKPALVL